MIRSVTRSMVGWRLFMPAYSVAFGQGDRRARAPAPGVVSPGRELFLSPLLADRIDPGPLRFHFVAADEQRLIALQQVEQQALVGNPALDAGERVRHRDVERDFAQRQPVAVEPRYL